MVEEAPKKEKLTVFEEFVASNATSYMYSCGIPVELPKRQEKGSLQENMRILMKYSKKREYRTKARLAEMYNSFWKKYSKE